MRLRRMLVLYLPLTPDGPGGYGPVVACRDIRSRDCGRPSNNPA